MINDYGPFKLRVSRRTLRAQRPILRAKSEELGEKDPNNTERVLRTEKKMKISRIIKELKVEGSLHYSARFEDRETMQRFSASSSRRCTKITD